MSKREWAIITVAHTRTAISGAWLLSSPYVKTLAHKPTSGLMPAAQPRVACLCWWSLRHCTAITHRVTGAWESSWKQSCSKRQKQTTLIWAKSVKATVSSAAVNTKLKRITLSIIQRPGGSHKCSPDEDRCGTCTVTHTKIHLPRTKK